MNSTLKALNELLVNAVKDLNKVNKKAIITMVKDVILPAMKKELKKQESPVLIIKNPVKYPNPIIQAKKDKSVPQSGNGHKKEKVRSLQDWEKNIIRTEFIKRNGEITNDACLEIKKKLAKETAIFQVTGFVSLLHKYVINGELSLPSPQHYYNFQYLKKHGEKEYNREIQSGKNTKVITIAHA